MQKRLEDYLQRLAPQGIALAFSGGVDSTLLLAILSGLKKKEDFPLKAVSMLTILQDEKEIKEAQNIAQKFGVEHEILTFNPLTIEAVRYNRKQRCYFCKKALFEQFCNYARAHGLKYVIDGTNADDLTVFRPGQKALRELNIISPLAELGINKKQIRELSAELGLPTADKPAAPCMATRFEYDTVLDEEQLNRVKQAEDWLRRQFPQLTEFRLRVHKNLARLEVLPIFFDKIMAERALISHNLKQFGFDYITLDLDGFRSGSFDKINSLNTEGKR